MLIGINNSVLYIDYLQKVKNKVIAYHTAFHLFHTRSQELTQFDAKK